MQTKLQPPSLCGGGGRGPLLEACKERGRWGLPSCLGKQVLEDRTEVGGEPAGSGARLRGLLLEARAREAARTGAALGCALGTCTGEVGAAELPSSLPERCHTPGLPPGALSRTPGMAPLSWDPALPDLN